MAVDGVQAQSHGDHRDMGTTGLAPCIDLRREVADAAPRKHHIVPAEVLDRPAEAGDAITQPFPGVDDVVDAAAEEDEAVRQAGGPVERRLAGSTEPDGDGARRLGHEGGSVDPVEAAREVDDRFCEQPAEQLDLLLLPGAAGTEVLPRASYST